MREREEHRHQSWVGRERLKRLVVSLTPDNMKGRVVAITGSRNLVPSLPPCLGVRHLSRPGTIIYTHIHCQGP
jgi:hypothetical protein